MSGTEILSSGVSQIGPVLRTEVVAPLENCVGFKWNLAEWVEPRGMIPSSLPDSCRLEGSTFVFRSDHVFKLVWFLLDLLDHGVDNNFAVCGCMGF